MRRKDRALSREETIRLLINGEYGVFSTTGNGQPYGVPVNYVYLDDCIYFHCALVGQKLDNLESNEKASFCVVGRTNILPAEFSTEYESVISSGCAEVIHGDERYRALVGLLEKYCPTYLEEGKAYIEKLDKQTAVVRMRVEEMSGKSKPVTI